MVLEKIELPKPKKLSEEDRPDRLNFSSDALIRRPEIARKVALTIAQLADVDAVYQLVIIALLKAEARSVVQMLRAIGAADAREKTIERIIEANADSELRSTYSCVKSKIREVRNVRNDFAHGIWGERSDAKAEILLTSAGNINISYGIAKRIQLVLENGGDPSDLVAELSNSPKSEDTQIWSDIAIETALRASAGAKNALQAFLACAERGPRPSSRIAFRAEGVRIT